MYKKRLKRVYGGVEAYRAKPGTKEYAFGKRRVYPWSTGNRIARNCTGGLIVIDIDVRPDEPDKSADFKSFCEAFPGVRETPTLRIQSRTTGAFHLVYRWPEEYPYPVKSVKPGKLAKGVEVPPQYMLPGSVVDGRKYKAVDRTDPAVIPDSLAIELVNDLRSIESDEVPARRVTPDDEVAVTALVAQMEQAGPGQTNEVYKAVAPVLVDLLGIDEAEHRLSAVWPGDDDELRLRLESTEQYITGRGNKRKFRTNWVEYSIRRHNVLCKLMESVLVSPWVGRNATNQRRVMVALVDKALADNHLVIEYPVETMANKLGLKPEVVRRSLRSLRDGGFIGFPSLKGGKSDLGHVSLLGSVMGGLLLPKGFNPLMDTTGVPYDYPYKSIGPIGPLSPLWRVDGFTGRHGQLFELVNRGVGSRGGLCTSSGASSTTVKDCVTGLVKAGLIEDTDGALRVSGNASERAQAICVESGVHNRYESVKRGINKEHSRLAQWQSDRAAEAQEWLEEMEMREMAVRQVQDEDDEQLRQQLGLE